MFKPSDLRSYQWKAFWVLMRQMATALFIDMGLGKTIVVLSAIKALKHKKLLTKPVLIVAPIRVMYGVWMQEAALWAHTRGLTFSIVHGSAKKRLEALNTPADIYLINPHGIVWLLELFNHKKAIDNWPFGWLVVDESSAFKAAGTQRFKKLRYYTHLFERRTIMTGTPTPNHLLELWSQIYLLDDGERLGSSFTRFKERFFYQADHQGYEIVPRRGAREYILRLIGDLTLRMDLEDWKAVPPTVYNRVNIELPQHARELYDQFEEEMFLELAAGDVEALNAATLTGRCHQLANGAIYSIERGSNDKIWEPVHDAKLEALQEILDETSTPVLVAYHFKHDLYRLRTLYPDAPVLGSGKGSNTDKIINEWNAGKHPVLFAHPASAAHGLNMQHGPGHTIVFFSLTWSLELHDQLVNRIGGARAKQKVVVHYIVAKDTTDEAIMRAKETKARGQQGLLNAIKAYRRERQRPRAEDFQEEFV